MTEGCCNIRIKVCGLTDPDQALETCMAGADAIGFVFTPKSPRLLSREDARHIIKKMPPMVQSVGVFVDESIDTIREIVEFCGIDLVQLHGSEPPGFCKLLAPRVIKAFRVKNDRVLQEIENYSGAVRGILIDTWARGTHGGTGKTFDWDVARKIVASIDMPVILAGGLEPGNVEEAVSKVRPWGVDVSSGVETAPGQKSIEKIKEFIRNARACATSW